jgi:hypothetical protein
LRQIVLDVSDAKDVLTEKADRTFAWLTATHDEIHVVERDVEDGEGLHRCDGNSSAAANACVATNTSDVEARDAVVVQAQRVLLGAGGTEHAPEGAAVEQEECRASVDLCFDGRPQTVHRDREHGAAIQLAAVRSMDEERNDQEQRQKKRGPTLGAVRHGIFLASDFNLP